MTDTPATPDTSAKDWRATVFLPKTDFPMKAGLAGKEPQILERWAKIGIYDRLREQRAGRERFILHDGPPYANGDLHMGHAMNKVLKDIIVRSQSLLGKDAPYIPGWDCHGLPIEWKIEEAYRARKKNKDEVPAAEFRAECRAYAEHWVGVQRAQFERLGVMGDWDDPYLTMKFEAEAAIVNELLKFATSGQLYRGAKPVMWSPVEKTALAEAEVEYEDIVSTQIDVAFEIVEAPKAPELVGAHAVVWTTTPWTIPVNQALSYGEEIEYSLFELKTGALEEPALAHLAGKRFLVATSLVPAFLKRIGSEWDNSDAVEVYYKGGWAMEGAIARHPMHHLGGFFARPRPFLPGEFVTTDTGTGLVHMAPDHGEDDFELCRANGIDPVFAVEGDGKYRADWAWLGGQGSVINGKFNAPDGPICSDLREAGALLAASQDYSHSYPHSWRSKAKVIFRATPQWFIPMDRPLEDRAAPLCKTEADIRRSQSNTQTLRQTALAAIDETRWVPARSKNRIGAMVSDRPDWVISRQRAWGVPIALYVNRRTGDYLRDPAVNARIVDAFKTGGADAWFAADHREILGPDHPLDDYEVVTDILDVWFDSGSTHAFVIEARYGPSTPDGKPVRADLYLEGSDQHRGWFQSSLLESCGTRGRAPYAAVLTHGFALDGQGRKMSKSLGNVVDPLKIIAESGADILRMWVASTDYFEDVRIGKEVLATTSDAYRKLRNTFRYLLGALDGFDPQHENVKDLGEIPDLELYILHLLAVLDEKLRDAASRYDFGTYIRLIGDFANSDLSAFFFDIRKDALYCDVGPRAPHGTTKRKAYRFVLNEIFESLVRYVAPILCFTAEEVWLTRHPEAVSVHLLEWGEVDANWIDPELAAEWGKLREVRRSVTEQIEHLRRNKVIGSSLEARVGLTVEQKDWYSFRQMDLAELFITSGVILGDVAESFEISIAVTEYLKCGRCWRHMPEVPEDGALCGRCEAVVNG